MFYELNGVCIDENLFRAKLECDYEKCKGACCKGEGLGTPVNREDIKRIKKHLGRVDFYHYERGARLVCRENGDCSLLNGNLCTINDVKPDFCILFPVLIESRDGKDFMIFQPYSECSFKKSEDFFLMHIEKVLERRYGKEWVDILKEALTHV